MRASAPYTCSGTPTSPGVLTGTYTGNVMVSGLCEVNSGPAVVHGSLTVMPGSALLAAFALDDATESGSSSLTVRGSVKVEKDGTLVLGCEAAHFACLDDPDPSSPTLSSRGTIRGNLLAVGALGVIVHNSSIGGSVVQLGGGGGKTGYSCTPEGIFAAFGLPPYSDYEDNAVGGGLSVVDLRTCWFGALRNDVHGNLVVGRARMGDPDGNEVVSNYVNGTIFCVSNKPAIQFGDSGGTPNVVAGRAFGQCSFRRLAPNPAPDGTLEHISIRATS